MESTEERIIGWMCFVKFSVVFFLPARSAPHADIIRERMYVVVSVAFI
jgi:hypothetical protein